MAQAAGGAFQGSGTSIYLPTYPKTLRLRVTEGKRPMRFGKLRAKTQRI